MRREKEKKNGTTKSTRDERISMDEKLNNIHFFIYGNEITLVSIVFYQKLH